MKRYATKIGELRIRANRPITEKDRRAVSLQLLKRGSEPILTVGGDLEIVTVVYPHGEHADG